MGARAPSTPVLARSPPASRSCLWSRWRIRVNHRYPAYISWETYERIRAMLKENYAAYDRHHTRGVPRPGKALLHGLVYCGECGHKMVVQYKNATRYLCNYLRQQYGVPVCQYIPADPVDDVVVQAFFADPWRRWSSISTSRPWPPNSRPPRH